MTEGCLRVGQQAPDFSATAVENQEFKTLSLSDFRGQYVVLFFYPQTSPSFAPLKLPPSAIAPKNSKTSTPKFQGFPSIANFLTSHGFKQIVKMAVLEISIFPQSPILKKKLAVLITSSILMLALLLEDSLSSIKKEQSSTLLLIILPSDVTLMKCYGLCKRSSMCKLTPTKSVLKAGNLAKKL